LANPTTNYGFVLPTSSDLVTDLPADFDVALQGVDTRLKALQPGTTLGDIAYSSTTANTNTRLGIGSTGQVLTVAGGVPTWAAPAGGGKVLQVVSANTTTQVSSSSTTYVTTGLTATITPTLSTSKILVLVTQNGCFKNNGNSNNALNIRLRRSSTTLAASTFVGYTATASENQVGTVSFSYLDSPATTSATTYLTEFSNFSATSFVAVQQNTGDTSSIVLLEIGA
jgi:hypothetical protein